MGFNEVKSTKKQSTTKNCNKNRQLLKITILNRNLANDNNSSQSVSQSNTKHSNQKTALLNGKKLTKQTRHLLHQKKKDITKYKI